MTTDPRIHQLIAADRAERLRADYGRPLRLPRVALRLPAWLPRRSSSAARLRSSRA
jgi:hypothetical protein